MLSEASTLYQFKVSGGKRTLLVPIFSGTARPELEPLKTASGTIPVAVPLQGLQERLGELKE